MNASRSSGIALIEVLVVLVILAIGIMGAVGMQLTAMRTAQESAFHTTATLLASDMAEKMRSNFRQMGPGKDLSPYLQVDHAFDGEQQAATTGLDCYSSPCNEGQLADFDIAEWLERVEATLPKARVKICVDSMPWNPASKALRWECTAPTLASHSSATVVIKIGWQTTALKQFSRPTSANSEMLPRIALSVPIA